jgi:hypothetical protein
MDTRAIFPSAAKARGMYESFYLRAVSPERPLGVWIRYTVLKRPGRPPRGSVWCTLFDGARERVFQSKTSTERLRVPDGGWIAIEESQMGPGRAEGSCGDASWTLQVESSERELLHLSPEWLYRGPLPRTKLTSPAPAARFDGVLELGGEMVDIHGWEGMVGHNWGAEHAERWIWLHGTCFGEQPQAWIDVALGRLKLAGTTTPWVATGALSFGGRRYRIGGLAARGLSVHESPHAAELHLPGERGLQIDARVSVPPGSSAGWRYGDPRGGEHDVVNCSIAGLELVVRLPGGNAAATLSSDHGGAYELGMRDRDHGVQIAPFPDE